MVRNAYAKKVYVDRAFQKKTNELVQSKIGVKYIEPVFQYIEVNEETIEQIKSKHENDNTKVINLVKSIPGVAQSNHGFSDRKGHAIFSAGMDSAEKVYDLIAE